MSLLLWRYGGGDYLDKSNLHTIWHLSTQSWEQLRWGGLCGALKVHNESTIATSLTLLFDVSVVNFGWII